MGFDLLRSLKMAPMLSSSPFPTLPPERLRSLKTLFNNSSSPSGRGDPKSCLLNNWLQKLKNKELIPIVTDSTRELAFSLVIWTLGSNCSWLLKSIQFSVYECSSKLQKAFSERAFKGSKSILCFVYVIHTFTMCLLRKRL